MKFPPTPFCLIFVCFVCLIFFPFVFFIFSYSQIIQLVANNASLYITNFSQFYKGYRVIFLPFSIIINILGEMLSFLTIVNDMANQVKHTTPPVRGLVSSIVTLQDRFPIRFRFLRVLLSILFMHAGIIKRYFTLLGWVSILAMSFLITLTIGILCQNFLG